MKTEDPFKDATIIDCRVPADELYYSIPTNEIPKYNKFKFGVVFIVKRECAPKITELAATRAGVRVSREMSIGEKELFEVQRSAIIKDLLAKHGQLDKGTLPDEDYKQNTDAIANRDDEGLPTRIFSTYDVDGVAVWVITEVDESQTTILLPSEY